MVSVVRFWIRNELDSKEKLRGEDTLYVVVIGHSHDRNALSKDADLVEAPVFLPHFFFVYTESQLSHWLYDNI